MTARPPVDLDRGSGTPLYLQLAHHLLERIHGGELSPGDLIEPEVDLAERLSLSRPTVRRAIAELVDRGLLVRRRGVGTVVATGGIQQSAALNSLYDDLAAQRRHPRTELLTLDEVVQPRAAAILGLPQRTRLLHVTRLRYVDELPLAILENWLPPDSPVADALIPERLEQEGLYAILRRTGLAPARAQQTFGARNATGAERRLLHLTRADPLLTMWRTAYDGGGHPIECGDHRYRGDQYSISVTVALGD